MEPSDEPARHPGDAIRFILKAQILDELADFRGGGPARWAGHDNLLVVRSLKSSSRYSKMLLHDLCHQSMHL